MIFSCFLVQGVVPFGRILNENQSRNGWGQKTGKPYFPRCSFHVVCSLVHVCLFDKVRISQRTVHGLHASNERQRSISDHARYAHEYRTSLIFSPPVSIIVRCSPLQHQILVRHTSRPDVREVKTKKMTCVYGRSCKDSYYCRRMNTVVPFRIWVSEKVHFALLRSELKCLDRYQAP